MRILQANIRTSIKKKFSDPFAFLACHPWSSLPANHEKLKFHHFSTLMLSQVKMGFHLQKLDQGIHRNWHCVLYWSGWWCPERFSCILKDVSFHCPIIFLHHTLKKQRTPWLMVKVYYVWSVSVISRFYGFTGKLLQGCCARQDDHSSLVSCLFSNLRMHKLSSRLRTHEY